MLGCASASPEATPGRSWVTPGSKPAARWLLAATIVATPRCLPWTDLVVSEHETTTGPPGDGVNGKLELTPDAVAQRVGDEVVLVNLRTNLMYDLNRTAARLWDLLAAGDDISQIRAQLLREFDVDPAQLDREIASTVRSLTQAGFLRSAEGA
jgi:hypothetical protein